MTEQSADTVPVQEEFGEIRDDPGCSGCAWGAAGMGGCLLVVALIIGLTVLLGYNTLDGVIGSITGIFNPPPPVYNTISTALILERIQDLSQLTTSRYNFSNIVTSERELPPVLELLYRDRLTMVVVGHINAGIDLSALTEENLQIDGDTLIIQLPPPQLQDCFLNEQQSYVISQNTGVFARAAPNLDAETRRFAVREFREAALSEGILENANEQARDTITTTIQLLLDTVSPENVSAITVMTSPPVVGAPLPETCR